MIELTHFEKIGGPLTKRISLSEDGTLVSDGSACVMSEGRANRARFDGLGDVASFISKMPSTDAIALGRLRRDLASALKVTTQGRLSKLNGTAPANLISRTASFIGYPPGEPALVLIDVDTKGMPVAAEEKIDALGGFWAALCHVLPALATTGRIVRNSTSSGLSRVDTGEAICGSNGLHIYLSVADGGDIERFLYTLHEYCWLAGLGWYWIGAGGALLDRSLVDRTVFAAERLVFEGAPVLDDLLHQDQGARAAVAHEGSILDTKTACPSLRIVETAKLREIKAKAAYILAPQRAAGREQFVAAKAKALADKTSVSLPAARRIIERQCDGVLRPDVELPFDRPELAGTTVKDVLASPETYVGETLADPLEGVAYGRGKAKIMQRADGSPWINSFAHGRTRYELKYDARAAREAVDAAADEQITDVFTDVTVNGDLDQTEVEELRGLVASRTGIGKRTLTAKLRDAQKEKATRDREERRHRQAAERMDSRPQFRRQRRTLPGYQ